MNPKNLPQQIRHDLKSCAAVLLADGQCSAIWLEAVAEVLEEMAAQIRTALGPGSADTISQPAEPTRFLAARHLTETVAARLTTTAA